MPLDSLSTTKRIIILPNDDVKCVMKSMDKEFQTLSVIGSVCMRPCGVVLNGSVVWQIMQLLIY